MKYGNLFTGKVSRKVANNSSVSFLRSSLSSSNVFYKFPLFAQRRHCARFSFFFLSFFSLHNICFLQTCVTIVQAVLFSHALLYTLTGRLISITSKNTFKSQRGHFICPRGHSKTTTNDVQMSPALNYDTKV